MDGLVVLFEGDNPAVLMAIACAVSLMIIAKLIRDADD